MGTLYFQPLGYENFIVRCLGIINKCTKNNLNPKGAQKDERMNSLNYSWKMFKNRQAKGGTWKILKIDDLQIFKGCWTVLAK